MPNDAWGMSSAPMDKPTVSHTHPTTGTHLSDFLSAMYTSPCVFMKYVRHHAYLESFQNPPKRQRGACALTTSPHISAFFTVICMSEDRMSKWQSRTLPDDW